MVTLYLFACPLLGREEQTKLMQLLELLVPVPRLQLGPAGVAAAFSLAPAPRQRSLRHPCLCITWNSPAAGWLGSGGGSGGAAPRRERGWRVTQGSCR